jgi:putative acetyltransferase
MTTSDVCIRPAGSGDAAAMARVFTTAIEAKSQHSYGPRERAAWAAQGSLERFAAMAVTPGHILLVAEEDGIIVGLGGLCGCEVSLLYAGPEASPGTGSRMLAAIEAYARRLGLNGLTLTASRNAVPFYARRGYAIMGLASRPLPGGLALPVCLMAKPL